MTLGLTKQQAAAVELTVQGFTGPEVAKRMGIGVSSVKSYLYQAHQRLGVTTRAELCKVVFEDRESALRARLASTDARAARYRAALEHIANNPGSLGLIAQKALRP